MPILRLTDGEERLLLSVYDLWQHKRVLMSQITRERRMRILSLNQTVVQKITASIKLMANNPPRADRGD